MDINWNVSARDISKFTDAFIKKSSSVSNKIIDMDINDKTYPKFICLLSDDMTDYISFHSICTFLQFVSSDKELKKECRISDNKLNSYIFDLNTNEKIYNKLLKLYSYAKKNNLLRYDDAQFLKHTIDSYKRYGADLDIESKKKLIKIKEEISKIESHIIENMVTDDERYITVSNKDLIGLPKHIRKSFNGKIALNESNHSNCMKHLKNENIRKKIDFEYRNKYSDHMINIARLVVLRDKHAKILSYNNHSDFVTDLGMSKSSEEVGSFLDSMSEIVGDKYKNELKIVERLKKVDYEKSNNSNNIILNSSDIQYYITKWKKEYGLNEEDISKYFPVEHVIEQVLRIYKDLFDLVFIKEKMETTWDKDVILYGVYHDEVMIGQFYLDLYERPGKFGHIKCFSLQPSCIYPLELNKYIFPISALISSFKRNSCLSHSNVVSLFHEFGHIIHQMCGKTVYGIFSGTNVEHDFVELPSTVLEDLCWNRIILKKLSKHIDTGDQLPDDIIHKMINIKYLNIGLSTKSNVIVGIYDNYIHSSKEFIEACLTTIKSKDNKECKNLFMNLYKGLYEHVMKGITLNAGSLMPIIWTNFLGNSECKNYGYLWSRAYASDVYHHSFENKYTYEGIIRECHRLKLNIFNNGGTVSGEIMLKNHLNRKPSVEGFIKMNRIDNDDEMSFYLETERIREQNCNDTEISNNFSEILDTCTYEV